MDCVCGCFCGWNYDVVELVGVCVECIDVCCIGDVECFGLYVCVWYGIDVEFVWIVWCDCYVCVVLCESCCGGGVDVGVVFDDEDVFVVEWIIYEGYFWWWVEWYLVRLFWFCVVLMGCVVWSV